MQRCIGLALNPYSFYTVEFLQAGELRDLSNVVGLCTVAMLTAEELCALNRHYVTLPRAVRKTIFRLRLWQTAVGTSKGNSGELWEMLQDVLGETNGEISDAHTADDFATFFKNKVDSVRSSTATSPLYDVPCRAARHPRPVN